MSPPETLIAIGLLGAALGVVNAWGLRHGTRAASRARRPALLLTGSFLARAALTLVPILVLAEWHPDRLVVGIASFLMVRLLAVDVTTAASPPSRHLTGSGSMP